MNLVILFSGQGLQKTEHFIKLSHHMSEKDKALFHQIVPVNAMSSNEIFDNVIAQPFIFALQYQRYQSLMQALEAPMILAGYSLGEVSAWCCSMNVSFEQGLQIVSMRATIMQDAADEHGGLMSVQGLNSTQINDITKNSNTYVSIKQSETQYIIAGAHHGLSHAEKLANELGAKHTKRLNVTIASHSPLMGKADERFLTYLDAQHFPKMTSPIISATDANKYDGNDVAKMTLAKQITHSLDWDRCMNGIKEHQPDIILEIGPGNALSKMVNNVMPDVPCRSYDDFSGEEGVLAWLDKQRMSLW